MHVTYDSLIRCLIGGRRDFLNDLGYCIYVSTFDKQKDFLKGLKHKSCYIFTSLHIGEERNEQYKVQVEQMMVWLNRQGFKVIADVSKRTLAFFGEKDMISLARRLGISILRLDYGFSDEETLRLANYFPIAFNASTTSMDLVRQIKGISPHVFAIHNYYPRAYTGLSRRQFEKMNEQLEKEGIEVMAFIPNERKSRGPIYEGLPTLEHERHYPSAVSYLEMKLGLGMKYILLSDLGLEPLDEQLITDYEETKVMSIPCKIEEKFEYLYNQIFTIRIDSSEYAYRLVESREFATAGSIVVPFNCIERSIGCITCDNLQYGRYSGEIQIIRKQLPQDDRVNVIGEIDEQYLDLTKFIKNGCQIKFIKGEG